MSASERDLDSVYVITGLHGQDGAYLIDAILDEMHEKDEWQKHDSVTFLCPVRNLRASPGLAKAEARVASEKAQGHDVTLDVFICDLAGDCQELRKRLLLSPYLYLAGHRHIYAMAALSHVGESWKDPSWVLTQNLRITTNLLEIAKDFDRRWLGVQSTTEIDPKYRIKLFFAGTSELFNGKDPYTFVDEGDSYSPQSPYAVSKLAGVELCKVYKEAYDLDVRVGIMFNHESPLRGPNFFTQKVVREMARMNKEVIEGKVPQPMKVGQLIGGRDWSRASTLMRGVVRLMNHPSRKVMSQHGYLTDERQASNGVVFSSGKMTFLGSFIDKVLTRFPALLHWATKRTDQLDEERRAKDPSYDPPKAELFDVPQEVMTETFVEAGPDAAEAIRPRTLAERAGLVYVSTEKAERRPSDVYYLCGNCGMAISNGFLGLPKAPDDEIDALIDEMVEAVR